MDDDELEMLGLAGGDKSPEVSDDDDNDAAVRSLSGDSDDSDDSDDSSEDDGAAAVAKKSRRPKKKQRTARQGAVAAGPSTGAAPSTPASPVLLDISGATADDSGDDVEVLDEDDADAVSAGIDDGPHVMDGVAAKSLQAIRQAREARQRRSAEEVAAERSAAAELLDDSTASAAAAEDEEEEEDEDEGARAPILIDRERDRRADASEADVSLDLDDTVELLGDDDEEDEEAEEGGTKGKGLAPARSSSGAGGDSDDEGNFINVVLAFESGAAALRLRLHREAQMSRVLEAARGAEAGGVALALTCDGVSVADDDTAALLGLAEGGTITAGPPTPFAAGGGAVNAVEVTVRLGSERKNTFKIRKEKTFGKLLRAVCKKWGLPATKTGMPAPNVAFCFDGERLTDEDTPDVLDMEDGDIIDVEVK
eukprot:g843.t1